MERNSTVLVHWPRLGPYHVARLCAASKLLSQHQMKLAALEISSSDDEYLWEFTGQNLNFERHTLFPDIKFENIPVRLLLYRVWSFLTMTDPSVVFINGYSTKDALTILLWCRMKGRTSILMSESKADDSRRRGYIELIKMLIVRQFDASLCGGSPHKKYLENLGMPPEHIFDGYDAVDNQFFIERTDLARQSSDRYPDPLRVADDRPYFLASGRFIPRKNFCGLIQAFYFYKQLCMQNEYAPWRLLILGDGPERDMMETEIKKYHLEADIFLAGIQTYNDLPAYYALASAFMHPALHDQWGLVVNEAMASGLPVLVSEGAGCAIDLIENEVEGFKFDPVDLKTLGALMYRVSSGMLDLDRMGKAAREKILQWGAGRFARGMLQAIQIGCGQ